jgi:hypothetical protein
MQKNIHLLELHDGDKPINLGVFTSLPTAKAFLKTLSKKRAYAVYKLPTNTGLTRGRKLEDVQGFFNHWHFGTNEVDFVEMDEEGNITDQGTRTEVEWPE